MPETLLPLSPVNPNALTKSVVMMGAKGSAVCATKGPPAMRRVNAPFPHVNRFVRATVEIMVAATSAEPAKRAISATTAFVSQRRQKKHPASPFVLATVGMMVAGVHVVNAQKAKSVMKKALA
jgi:hypothetical protein